MKKAFSMIELVFVIVILGIVASIGASIIAKAYETYIVQKATHNASIKTELAALQIAQRLSNSIPWTVVVKNPAAASPFIDYEILSQLKTPGETYTALEWVGIDDDSFNAVTPPGWSGYCDINSSTVNGCTTQGSNLNDANTIIRNLSKNKVDLANGRASTFFKTGFFDQITTYAPKCIGLVASDAAGTVDTSCSIPTNQTGANALTFTNGNNKYRAEQYVLSWSAYAIVPENFRDLDGDGRNEWDLRLYYNYQPWIGGEKYNDGTASSSILINNVSVFKMTAFANTIRFKICVKQLIGETKPITVCKEKAVVR
jgi:prepilin-type N-terminal cleavage/methylation domain-containing protein